MNYNLFLDDIRMPSDVYSYTFRYMYLDLEWTIVRNFNEFIQTITKNGIPEYLSFDHDLANIHYNNQLPINYDEYEEKTGYHCAKWLIDYCIDNKLDLPKNIFIHTMNVEGGKNIASLFNTYDKIHGK